MAKLNLRVLEEGLEWSPVFSCANHHENVLLTIDSELQSQIIDLLKDAVEYLEKCEK